jgi:hypothetical protein
VEDHLDKGVSVQELYEAMAALEAASASVHHALRGWILKRIIATAKLLVQVFEDDNDEPNEGQEE